MRKKSVIADGWWDYTTLDDELLADAAKLAADDLPALSRPGFTVRFFDTLESFYVAEALEYVDAWKRSTADNPAGVCGPIGPTEQLPLVAQLVNDLELDVREGHFWAMDEWVLGDCEVPLSHPLSFAAADLNLCFRRIDKKLRMPDQHLHFPRMSTLSEYSRSFDEAKCLVMQGGQGDTKHWAFNDPPRRRPPHEDEPPTPNEYRRLAARVVELHPVTIMQNARTSGGGVVSNVPTRALSVGPAETWKCNRVSIWQAGQHDNAFGMRLTTLMLSKRLSDSAVPMSLLSDHPDVVFNFYRPGIGSCNVEMH